MRPQPFTGYREKATVWLDYTTGAGVTDADAVVRPKISRGDAPSLADLLDTAHGYGAERIMLSRAPEVVPGRDHWILAETPGWEPGIHWTQAPVTGRFTNTATGAYLEVHEVSEWFGSNDIAPAVAATAWKVTAAALGDAVPGARMALTPAGTGVNAWALSLPKGLELEECPPDVAAEIHKTTGQHRMEHLVAGESRCDCGACLPLFDPVATPKLDLFSYADGRFMYAGMTRELGTGGYRRLRRNAAADLLARDPHTRARFYVKFTVPDTWDHVGLLSVAHRNPADGWHYPNRPGSTFETWADAAELKIAADHGWWFDPQEAVEFNKSRVLDTWGKRMTTARSRVDAREDLSPEVRRASAAALRLMVIASIGNFASRGKERTLTVANPQDIPAEYIDTIQKYGSAYTYKVPGREPDARTRAFYRPELAAQIWARARARVLSSYTAASYTGPSGVLAMNPRELLGINGDAIYSTTVPAWALPAEPGPVWGPVMSALTDGATSFGDDGRVGRLRVKGLLENVETPVTVTERNILREQADEAGTPWGTDL